MLGVMFFHLPAGFMMWGSGVHGDAPWDLRWSTCWRRAALGHHIGSPDALCPIFFPDAVILGYERQCDEVGGLEVACHVCGHNNSVAVT